MSAVVKVSVADGVVMATDSRTTVVEGGKPRTFDGFRKLFVFRPDVPIALMTWGQNRIEEYAIGELIQKATDKLNGEEPAWRLDAETTTLPEVAERITNFLFHEYYQPAVEKGIQLKAVRLHYAGFSPGERRPEHVEYNLSPEHIVGPHPDANESVQVNFDAPFIARAMTGAAPEVLKALVDSGLDEEKCRTTLRKFGSQQLTRLVSPGMPLAEVAGLVRCLMDTEINLTRFGFEPDVIGGDIQMVVIDRHGCREMQFRPTNHSIPNSVWTHGNARHSR